MSEEVTKQQGLAHGWQYIGVNLQQDLLCTVNYRICRLVQ